MILNDCIQNATNNRNTFISLSVDTQAASSSNATSSSTPNFIKRWHNNNANSNHINNNHMPNNYKIENSESNDVYSSYRRMCEIRMRRVERYKKARSFCSLHDENGSSSHGSNENNNNNEKSKFCKKQPKTNEEIVKFDNSMRATSSSCSHLKTENNKQYGNSFDKKNKLRTFNDFLCKEYNVDDIRRLQSASRYSDLLDSQQVKTDMLPTNESKSIMQVKPDSDSIFVDNESNGSEKQLALKTNLYSPIQSSSSNSTSNESKIFLKNKPSQDNVIEEEQVLNSSGIDDEQADEENSPLNLQFEILREKMISMMENDVQLLKKLLTLGETIQELRKNSIDDASEEPIQGPFNRRKEYGGKSKDKNASNSLSKNSNNNNCFMELNREQNNNIEPNADGNNSSTITRLIVGKEEDINECDESDNTNEDNQEFCPNVQYFSRKNSVLRIPIPPRASNRMLGKRMPLRSDVFRCPRKNSYNVSKLITPEEDSGHSSASSSPPEQCSPNSSTENHLNSDIYELNKDGTLKPTSDSNEKYNTLSKLNASSSDEAATNDSGRAASDFDATSTIGSGSSRFSTFLSESFSIGTISSCGTILKDGLSNTQTIMSNPVTCNEEQCNSNTNKMNSIIVNLDEKCIVPKCN